MLTLAVYSLDLPAYACARLRLLGPAQALAGKVELRWAASSNGSDYAISAEAMQGADAVIFQRYFPMRETWPLVAHALDSGLPVFYETDDNFLAVPKTHPMRQRLEPVIPFAAELLARADCVTVSTPELQRAFASRARRVEIVPNLIDQGLWGALDKRAQPAPGPAPSASGQAVQSLGGLVNTGTATRLAASTTQSSFGKAPGKDTSASEKDGPRGPVRVVFAGTPSRREDLEFLAPALAQAKHRFGDGVSFTFLGCSLLGMPELNARVIPFQDDYAGYASTLAALRPDIGLAPLADSPFNRCKSAVKWLEYSALGAAGVYADLPPYAPVRSGVTGLIAPADPAQWRKALELLIADTALRTRLAGQAKAEVLARHSLAAGAKGYLRLWRSVIEERRNKGAPPP